jgi:hypothetical protein
MNTDDVGTVVQNAHLDQWHEVVVMAVGHASQKQREELLARLIERGDLHLLVLASMETAPEMNADLRREIQVKTLRLLPPDSMHKAKTIAAAGPYVLDLLANCQPRTIDEVTATIRALAETRLEEALPVIARFASDSRNRVFDEILLCMGLFDEETYGEAVLARSTRKYLWAGADATLHAAKYLPWLNQLDLPYQHEGVAEVHYKALPPTLAVLRLHDWPQECLSLISSHFHLATLGLHNMVLTDLRSLHFVDFVTELRLESTRLGSFEGIERWQDSLQRVSSVGLVRVDQGLLDELRAKMPHVTVTP